MQRDPPIYIRARDVDLGCQSGLENKVSPGDGRLVQTISLVDIIFCVDIN
jgi:hypothetical protein